MYERESSCSLRAVGEMGGGTVHGHAGQGAGERMAHEFTSSYIDRVLTELEEQEQRKHGSEGDPRRAFRDERNRDCGLDEWQECSEGGGERERPLSPAARAPG